MDYQWHDAVGNLGVLLVLGCYLFIQIDRMDIRAIPYSVLNGLGALLIMVSLYFDFNLSSFIIELAWLAISLFGICRRLVELKPGKAQSSG